MAKKVLVVGAGIAGPTVAFWLSHFGFETTLAERAPALREGGYVIDFWGVAFDLAQRMGILSVLQREGYRVQALQIVNDAGQLVGGFDAGVFRRLTRGRYLTVARSGLSRALYQRLDARTERRFGTSIRSLTQDEEGVEVVFDDGTTGRFDLVIGADGQHSRVRELVFGPESQFEKYLGYNVAAFELPGYRPRNDDTYVMHTQRGRQVGRFALHDDRTLFLFIWIAADAPVPHTLQAQRALLHEQFGDASWESTEILQRLAEVDEIYMDRVSQIRMASWTRGRVA